FRQKLQSHKAAKFDVLGLVDHTHPAPAELVDDAVVGDGLTNHEEGGGPREILGLVETEVKDQANAHFRGLSRSARKRSWHCLAWARTGGYAGDLRKSANSGSSCKPS